MPRVAPATLEPTLEMPPQPPVDSDKTIEQTISPDPEPGKAPGPRLGDSSAGPDGTILMDGTAQSADTADFSLLGSKRDSSLDDFGEFSLADVASAALPGDWPTVAGYQILGELGRGGMGVVYKARQRGLRRLVALKMVLSGAHAGPQHLARFQTEAEAVARLQHPIIWNYDVGEQERPALFLSIR